MQDHRQDARTTPVSPTAAPLPSSRRRVMIAGIAGNVLEWYDFALYGYLATFIASTFFPPGDEFASLIGTYAIFAVGFLARPLGGAVYGAIGDRLGRRWLLMISVVMMGLPTCLLGLLPTWSSVGDLAPLLLILVRFVQGVSAGGEFTGSIVFLVEHAPRERRGLYGSLAQFGAMLGGLLGASVAWLATTLIPADAMSDWGWRVPFVTSVIIAGAGLWVRLGVPEPPAFQQMKDAGDLEQQPLRTALREHPKEILITAGLNWPVSAGYYIVFVWITSDLNKVVGLPLSTTLAINSAGLLFATLMAPLLGALSDRIGPRPILAAAGIAATAASAPLLLLAGLGTISAALAAQIALALIMAGYLSVLPTVFVSLHSARVRCSSLSIGYNIAVMVFGGTAPLTATVLIRWTGWQPAPGLYLAVAAIVGLTLLRFVPRRYDWR